MLIDISVPVKHGMVHWPGDPEVIVQQTLDMNKGDVCNYTKLDCGVHIGTHMDAPRHFVANAAGMETLPLDAVVGPARVVTIADPQAVRRQELEPLNLQPGERILFKTSNSTLRWDTDEFDRDFVYISNEAAQYLVERGVRTVGIDYLSVGGFYHDGIPTHQTLLGAGVWVIEGINLSAVEPGTYELICLPVKIAGADGSPARAILRTL